MRIFFAFLFLIVSFSIYAQKNDAMIGFKKISPLEFSENAIELIGKQWMLVAAGNPDTKYNMMTASWGTLGWLWEKPVSFIFVRPQRYTFEFTEKEDYYTLTFFEEKDREVLRQMGSKSGRNFDKMNYKDLSPIKTPNGSVAFKEAKIIIECKKLYSTFLKEEDFADKNLSEKIYPTKDFHKMYVGEILNIWIKE
jgi:flavin reductase (DIM6/NTAB) family NADH-FMN oxidoreductase RutF